MCIIDDFTTNTRHCIKIEYLNTQPDICALVPTGVGELCPDIDDILLCSFTIGSRTKKKKINQRMLLEVRV